MSDKAVIGFSDTESETTENSEESSSNEEQKADETPEWQPLKNHENYEIYTDFPYQIRKRISHRPIKTFRDKTKGNYYVLHLDGKRYYLHHILANHFIDNPHGLRCVDHIDHDRGNNHIENLRWCSQRQNTNNRSDQTFVDEIPEEAIKVDQCNGWNFEELYFHDDTFYVYNGINYVVKPRHQSRDGYYFISVHDTSGKKRSIYYTTFKREYQLI